MFRTTPKELPERKLRDAAYYDAEYYSGAKSNWGVPYVWDNFSGIFTEWMKFILNVFPESVSFLNVGCGRGFMERMFVQSKGSTLLPITIHGFDHSEHAIATAEEVAQPFIECASLDNFKFRERYDVMLAFDVFEHVSEAQAIAWLKRSRKHVDDCICAVIALDVPSQRMEASHCNLQNRAYWHNIFLKCGWVHTQEYKMMNDLAPKHAHVRNCQCEMFIYGAGNKTVADRIIRRVMYVLDRTHFFIKALPELCRKELLKLLRDLRSTKWQMPRFALLKRKPQAQETPIPSPS